MRLRSFVGCVAAATAACTSAQSKSTVGGGARASEAPDTIVGIVTEVGADPATWVSVRPATGRSLRLTGDVAARLRGISGVEVWLSGANEVDGFRVADFEVRRANGQPVDDGVVSVEKGRVLLRMRSGAQREVTDAPPALAALAGARIWVTRPVANQSPTYGVIQRAGTR